MTNFMIDPNEFSYTLNILLMVQNYNRDKIYKQYRCQKETYFHDPLYLV